MVRYLDTMCHTICMHLYRFYITPVTIFRIENLSLYSMTEIEIGFTKSLIEVAEEAGNVEACVAVKQPNTSVSLELFIFLDIVMSPGSAGNETLPLNSKNYQSNCMYSWIKGSEPESIYPLYTHALSL